MGEARHVTPPSNRAFEDGRAPADGADLDPISLTPMCGHPHPARRS